MEEKRNGKSWKDVILNGNTSIDQDRGERDWILERCCRVSSMFCGQVANGKRYRRNLAQEVVSTGTFRSGKRQAFSGRYGRWHWKNMMT